MKRENIDRLKEVLGIHTYFGEEHGMVEYLRGVLTNKGYSFEVDEVNRNIYVTKGTAKFYPCFVSHIDTVHRINRNMIVIESNYDGKEVVTGIDSETERPSGVGGDDKCGVYLCLEMLDKLDSVKVAFFAGEEFGMVGSKQLRKEFFEDVSYAIQYDSPKGNSMSMSLQGIDLFNRESEFGEIVKGPILEHGITDWARHPYTDAYQVIVKTKVSALNLAAGYHRYHMPDEYVVLDEVQNSFELGIKLVNLLGTDKQYVRERSEIENRYGDGKVHRVV